MMEPLKTIRNGAKARPTFSAGEMARRLGGLRAHMAADGVDAVLFTSYHNVNYFADFLYCAFGRPFGLVVTQDRVTSISANIDGGQPGRRTVGDNLVYTDWQRDNFFRAVQQLVPNRGRVGVEDDHLTVERHRKLQDALPDARLVDVAAACMRQRMIKSAEETLLIREGARIADLGGAAAKAAIGVGVAEHEVALAGTQAMVREIARTFPTPS